VNVTGGDYSATSTSAAAKIKGQTSVSITGASAGVTISGTGGPGVQIKGKANVLAEAVSKVSIKGGTMVNIESPVVQLGDTTIKIKGATILLDASGSVMIKGGGGTIKLDAGGITASGTLIKLNS
jgi:type VI secretion system secreted protein VgrG